MAHIGVKNRTDKTQHLMWDGKSVEFAPGQIRLVEGVNPDFVANRMHVSHKMEKHPQTGELVRKDQLLGLRLFDVMTVDEALKLGARPDEDPRVIALRAEHEAKAKERRALLADLKAELLEDGWAPPKSHKALDKKEEKAI